MATDYETRTNGPWTIVGFLIFLVVDASVAYAVLESPFGTYGLMDDSPPDGYLLAPILAGIIVGLLQTFAIGPRTSLIAAGLLGLGGVMSLVYIFPAGAVAVGCVLGSLAALPARRWLGVRGAMSASASLLLLAVAAPTYGLTRTDPPDLPLLETAEVSGGPTLVIDPQRRSKDAVAVLGDVADIGGCLGIVDRTAGRREFVVAWPRGTKASSKPYVLTYEGRSYRVGDFVAVRGGAPITMTVDLDAYAPDLPASCRGRGIVLAG